MARILIIDDDPDIREAVSEVLSFEGHEVFSAAEGEQGLVRCRQVRPELILLDLMMPGMNGWDFLRTLRRDAELALTPVVVVSALGRVPELPVAGFLPKPFGLDALVALVRSATRRLASGNGAGSHL